MCQAALSWIHLDVLQGQSIATTPHDWLLANTVVSLLVLLQLVVNNRDMIITMRLVH